MPFYIVEKRSGDLIANGSASILNIPMQGFRPFEVFDQVQIDEEVLPAPLTLADLIDQVYMGLLAANPFYSNVAYDDLLNPVALWNIGATGFRGYVGVGEAVSASISSGQQGRLDTNTIPAVVPFSQAQLAWSAYQVTISPDSPTKASQVFTPVAPDTLTAFLSNDAGLTFEPALSFTDITFPNTSNQIVVRFENYTSNPIYLGSFGVLY
jgi:hypothetical protein